MSDTMMNLIIIFVAVACVFGASCTTSNERAMNQKTASGNISIVGVGA